MTSSLSQYIKESAAEIGFDACGLAKAEPLGEEMTRFNSWLEKGYQAEMAYMSRHRSIRQNPEELQTGAKTVLVTLSNYYPQQVQAPDLPQIAKYAYGRDYHKVLLKMHKALLEKINSQQECQGRIFVDSAPVMERTWAVKAGLGFIGKNGMLIHPKIGLHTLISGIMLDIEVDSYDSVIERDCGRCRRCIDHCPNAAILDNKMVDANKCLSNLSIEHRGDFPEGIDLKNRLFGCDTCIDVCPYNKKKAHQIKDFIPPPKRLELSHKDWEELSEDEFKLLFSGTALKRAKFSGIKRNLNHI